MSAPAKPFIPGKYLAPGQWAVAAGWSRSGSSPTATLWSFGSKVSASSATGSGALICAVETCDWDTRYETHHRLVYSRQRGSRERPRNHAAAYHLYWSQDRRGSDGGGLSWPAGGGLARWRGLGSRGRLTHHSQWHAHRRTVALSLHHRWGPAFSDYR